MSSTHTLGQNSGTGSYQPPPGYMGPSQRNQFGIVLVVTIILSLAIGIFIGVGLGLNSSSSDTVTDAAHLYIVDAHCAYVGDTNRDTGTEVILPDGDRIIGSQVREVFPDGGSLTLAKSGDAVRYVGRLVDLGHNNCAFTNSHAAIVLKDITLVP